MRKIHFKYSNFPTRLSKDARKSMRIQGKRNDVNDTNIGNDVKLDEE